MTPSCDRLRPLTRTASAVLLCSLFALSLHAASANDREAPGDDRLRIMDSFDLESAGDPQISPDGETVVYVRTAADVMTDRFYSNLWAIGYDGSGHRPLTSGKASSSSPRWSPSGDRLAFVSTAAAASGGDPGKPQIWVRDMSTGEQRPVTDLDHAPSGLQWSPDGEWLSFHMLVPGAAPDVADLPAAPPGAEWAPPPKVYDNLLYKFDQVGFLPHGTWQIFVVPAEGGTERQVTRGDKSFGGPGFAGTHHVWSPDGRSMYSSSNRKAESHLDPLDTEVYRIVVSTGELEAVTDRRGPDNGVDISPDGKTLVWTGFDDRAQGYQTTQLWARDTVGSGEARSLTQDLDRSVSNPVFSADGARVYFLYVSEGVTRVGSVNLDGETQEHVQGLGGGSSAYAGGQVTVAGNGHFAASVSDPTGGPNIAVGTIDRGDLTVVTDINRDVLGHKTLGEVEEIWYESSHDQRRVHGWIIKPPGFDPAKKYPLVLEIHGGPFAAYGPTFDLEKQMLAAAGYVILYTNPRGSTSYGQEFGNLIHHAYPGDDLHDLLSGVDAVIEKGYVDPDQLYVTGGSGGGVLTAWVIGNSDRFRAAVSIYPVIHWASWVLTADISGFGVKYWFPGLPWDHPENYAKRSLLSVVENVKTPTMVLTGEEDHRTPMSESEQYFAALQHVGTPSVLVRVPGEPHGIRRRPSHHAQKMSFMVGWFDRHRP